METKGLCGGLRSINLNRQVDHIALALGGGGVGALPQRKLLTQRDGRSHDVIWLCDPNFSSTCWHLFLSP